MHHASTYMYFKYSVRNYGLHRWFACELSSLFGVFVSYCCYLSHNNIFTCTVWFPVAHIKEKISKVIFALHNQFLEQFQWFCINNWFIISKDILVLFLSILYKSQRNIKELFGDVELRFWLYFLWIIDVILPCKHQ